MYATLPELQSWGTTLVVRTQTKLRNALERERREKIYIISSHLGLIECLGQDHRVCLMHFLINCANARVSCCDMELDHCSGMIPNRPLYLSLSLQRSALKY